MARYSDSRWPRYIPVAERRRRAAKKVAKMRKSGQQVEPVEVAGRKIATTFWGSAWCKNLESYSDYTNRLPRGRTYVRNGSVIDLQIEAGQVRALVSGSEIYQVSIAIKPLAKRRWTTVKRCCAGQIGSLVELLQGALSKSVMAIATNPKSGLFPAPREISLNCTCPDWATLCKHVAATLYGIGARLDQQPELLFTLRGLDPLELVEAAAASSPIPRKSRSARVLADDQLSSVFGIDLEMGTAPAKVGKKPHKKAPTKKTAARKTTPRKVTKMKTTTIRDTRKPAPGRRVRRGK